MEEGSKQDQTTRQIYMYIRTAVPCNNLTEKKETMINRTVGAVPNTCTLLACVQFVLHLLSQTHVLYSCTV